jgi:radical SAM protein with 4Fe4S-binding SPASM domain
MELRLPKIDESITVILKLAGETCNINCHYCYEKRKPYAQALVLQPETLAKFLDLCGSRPLYVVLHGGEPLLIGRKRITPLLRELRAYRGPLQLAMQTNGVMLNNAWLDYFDKAWPGLKISISLDGDAEANAHRVDFADRPTYARTIRALLLLAERQWDIGVIAVVTKRALGRAKELMYHYLEFPAIRVLKLSPCLDFNVVTKDFHTPNRRSIAILNPAGRGIPGWATSPMEYAQFLVDAWDAWRDTRAFRHFLLEPHLSIVRNLAGKESEFTHFSDRKEPFIVTLYPDGRIGSSDELNMPEALLGHVDGCESLDHLLRLDTNASLKARLKALLSKCGDCAYRTSCRGGSLADRFRYVGTSYDDEYCDYRKYIIDYVSHQQETILH